MKNRLRAPSPSLAISLLALFVALGGTAYAAVTLPRNSVGTKQLKKSAVVDKKIKNYTITKNKINKRTVAALKGNTGPRGPRGYTGAQGIQGPAGLTNYKVVMVSIAIPPSSPTTVSAECPTGQTAIAGGFSVPSGAVITSSHPTTITVTGGASDNAWSVTMDSNTAPQTLSVYADCATVQ